MVEAPVARLLQPTSRPPVVVVVLNHVSRVNTSGGQQTGITSYDEVRLQFSARSPAAAVPSSAPEKVKAGVRITGHGAWRYRGSPLHQW